MELGFVFYLLLAVIAVSAVAIVIAVLMQPTKASGGLGGLSGASSTDSVLGTSRNEVLAKFTWVLLVIFLGSALALGSLTASKIKEQDKIDASKSEVEQMDLDAKKTVPTTGDVEKAVEVPAVPAVEAPVAPTKETK